MFTFISNFCKIQIIVIFHFSSINLGNVKKFDSTQGWQYMGKAAFYFMFFWVFLRCWISILLSVGNLMYLLKI